MTDTTARAHTQKALDAANAAYRETMEREQDEPDCDVRAMAAAVRAYLDALDPAEVGRAVLIGGEGTPSTAGGIIDKTLAVVRP